MGFSVLVEMLNLRAKKVTGAEPVQLHQPYTAEVASKGPEKKGGRKR
jgi:hypothetical protein